MSRIGDLIRSREGDIREAAAYLIVGALTTGVNYGCYELLRLWTGIRPTVCTAISWAVSVLFAYVVNRCFVFRTREVRGKAMLREMGLFFAARILSGVLDMGIMWLFAERLGLNDSLVKLASNVLVIVANYFASKWMIFKKN